MGLSISLWMYTFTYTIALPFFAYILTLIGFGQSRKDVEGSLFVVKRWAFLYIYIYLRFSFESGKLVADVILLRLICVFFFPFFNIYPLQEYTASFSVHRNESAEYRFAHIYILHFLLLDELLVGQLFIVTRIYGCWFSLANLIIGSATNVICCPSLSFLLGTDWSCRHMNTPFSFLHLIFNYLIF